MDDRETKLKLDQRLDDQISARVKTTAILKALAAAEEHESRCYTALQMAVGESLTSIEIENDAIQALLKKSVAAEPEDPSDANRGGATKGEKHGRDYCEQGRIVRNLRPAKNVLQTGSQFAVEVYHAQLYAPVMPVTGRDDMRSSVYLSSRMSVR